jgi:hypothetical protein
VDYISGLRSRKYHFFTTLQDFLVHRPHHKDLIQGRPIKATSISAKKQQKRKRSNEKRGGKMNAETMFWIHDRVVRWNLHLPKEMQNTDPHNALAEAGWIKPEREYCAANKCPLFGTRQ